MDDANPYTPPHAALERPPGAGHPPRFAGFWVRVAATLIDSVLWVALTLPLLLAAYGLGYLDDPRLVSGPLDLFLSWVLPVAVVLAFWILRSATPGKMVFHARIVDAESLAPASPAQCVGRYLAYVAAALPVGLGLLWVAVDRRKQGWHDKLAGTVVVRSAR